MNIAQRAPAVPHPQTIFGIRVSPKLAAFAPPLVLCLTSLVVLWQYDPLHRSLSFDPGIFAYLSQLVAQGFAPHKYAFNEQASLAFFLGGAAMRLGDLVGLHPLIAFRFAAMLLVASAVGMTYVTGKMFTRSRAIAFLAGLVMLGYHGYNLRAAMTLEPKSLMLVLSLVTLYFLYRRNWLVAGAFAGATGLAWQIGWMYLGIALFLAAVQGGNTPGSRVRAVLMTAAAAAVIIFLYSLYFVWNGALVEMVQQTVLAPVLMHRVAGKPFDERIFKLAKTFWLGFGAHTVFGILGATGLVVWLGAHLRPWEFGKLVRRAFYFSAQNRRTAGILLGTFGFIIYSFLDFQNYPDWIPLLPFISMFAAWLLWQGVTRILKPSSAPSVAPQIAFAVLALVLFGFSAYRAVLPMGGEPTRGSWQEQQRVADELNARLGPDATVWMIGKADLMFFMQRVNVNKYIYLFGFVDGSIDAFDPGGFKGMVNTALAQEPSFYVLARAAAKKFTNRANNRLIRSVGNHFTKLKRCRTVGGGNFYVRNDLADALFPVGGSGCLAR